MIRDSLTLSPGPESKLKRFSNVFHQRLFNINLSFLNNRSSNNTTNRSCIHTLWFNVPPCASASYKRGKVRNEMRCKICYARRSSDSLSFRESVTSRALSHYTILSSSYFTMTKSERCRVDDLSSSTITWHRQSRDSIERSPIHRLFNYINPIRLFNLRPPLNCVHIEHRQAYQLIKDLSFQESAWHERFQWIKK